MHALDEGTSVKSSCHAKSNQKLTNKENTDRNGDVWILDSGFSRRLVNDPSLLQDEKMSEYECHMAKGDPVKLLRGGS